PPCACWSLTTTCGPSPRPAGCPVTTQNGSRSTQTGTVRSMHTLHSLHTPPLTTGEVCRECRVCANKEGAAAARNGPARGREEEDFMNVTLRQALADVVALAGRLRGALEQGDGKVPDLLRARALVQLDKHRSGLTKLLTAVEDAARSNGDGKAE